MLNLRTFIVFALIGMFIYNVVDIKSNMVSKFANHQQQIEFVLAE
jgi:hypothetical protein